MQELDLKILEEILTSHLISGKGGSYLELLKNHSDNIDINNYFPNIINIKKVPQNIKKILEEKKLEFDNRKELERQQIMVDYLVSKGYKVQKPTYE